MDTAHIEIKYVPLEEIKIAEDRFRSVFTEKNLSSLQESISSKPGLLNAITVKGDLTLLTGESRLKAITALHAIDMPVFYQGEQVPAGKIPAIVCHSVTQEIHCLQAEFNENVHRENFTYMEESMAAARIAKCQQAKLNQEKAKLSPEELSAERQSKFLPLGIPLKSVSSEAIKETTKILNDGKSGGGYTDNTRQALRVAAIVSGEVEASDGLKSALSKAKSATEAKKLLHSNDLEVQRARLAAEQGVNFKSKMHTVVQGECLETLKGLKAASFDCCLTDPIYGINSNKFGDGAGKMTGLSHDYDDSPEYFKDIMPKILLQVTRLCKPGAHLYLACDIRHWLWLKEAVEASSDKSNPWKVPNAPFIQHKKGGGRVPVPGFTPRRSYEVWLYAYRGGKQELKMIDDVISCESDRTETHGASKPVELLRTFLQRSCMPGESVLDFMAGSGGVLPAAHGLKLKVTAIEQNPVSYGRCLERLRELDLNGGIY